MNILFVVPNIDGRVGNPPYNIALLKSFIDKSTNHKAFVADLTFHQQDWKIYLEELVNANKIDIIGVSVLSFEVKQSLNIACYLKEKFDIPIIMGGVHAILKPLELISNEAVDFVCTGEGEFVLKELLDNNLNGGGILGLWYKLNKKIYKNPSRQLFEDLDFLPFPDWGAFDLEKYFVFNDCHLTMMVSRGCPYHCTYCSNHALKAAMPGKYVRFRGVASVMEEIEHTYKLYNPRGFDYIQFIDDIFILDKDWTREFCNSYIENGYHEKIPWMASARANLVTKDIINQLVKAGCYELGMGIEAANDYIRNDVYKRKMTKQQIDHAVRCIKESGLKLRVQFIIGAPYETLEMMEESFKMAKKIDADVVQFPILMPLPGTIIRKVCMDEELIDKEFLTAQDMYARPVARSKYTSARQIKSFYKKVRNYQIKKYFFEGIQRKGIRFLIDLFVFVFYQKHKYKLEIQNAFKLTIKKYHMQEIRKKR